MLDFELPEGTGRYEEHDKAGVCCFSSKVNFPFHFLGAFYLYRYIRFQFYIFILYLHACILFYFLYINLGGVVDSREAPQYIEE